MGSGYGVNCLRLGETEPIASPAQPRVWLAPPARSVLAPFPSVVGMALDEEVRAMGTNRGSARRVQDAPAASW